MSSSRSWCTSSCFPATFLPPMIAAFFSSAAFGPCGCGGLAAVVSFPVATVEMDNAELSERTHSGLDARADPPDSSTEDRRSDEKRPRQEAGPSSGGLSHGAAGATPSPPSASEKSVAVDAVSDDEQHDAASESAAAAAEGHEPARAGVGRRG